MKFYLLIVLSIFCFALAAFGASIDFSERLPDAGFSAGTNHQLDIQKRAIQEMRTKMQNWATFSGYSARSGR